MNHDYWAIALVAFIVGFAIGWRSRGSSVRL